MADKALAKEEHVRHHVEVLLNDESTPEELRQAWFATRVRVVIDVANLLFSELKSRNQTALQPNPDPAAPHALAEHLRAAINYYQWALNHDQAYRSQIMLRQQITFCRERLSDYLAAENTLEEINKLCEMHPSDLNPALKMVKMLTGFRLENVKEKTSKTATQKINPLIPTEPDLTRPHCVGFPLTLIPLATRIPPMRNSWRWPIPCNPTSNCAAKSSPWCSRNINN